LQWTRIQAANNIIGTTVYAGQRLVIPASNAPVPTPAPTEPAPTPASEPTAPVEPTPIPAEPPASPETVIHVVQQGETLFTIGLRYGLQWTTIQAANGLVDTRIYVGQRLVIPANGSAVPIPAPEPPPLQGPVAGMTGKYFLVDLSEQRLYAFEGEQMVRTTLISSGRWPYPTVTGTFSVYLRYKAARMRGPGYDLANVPFTMYFYKGYGLHGTYWHNNFGTPMSHGCVNMPTPEAEWAYYWSDYGTPVIVQQ
jgi:lipoprotein-anchoring transpeptidase ErfK/SrfK